VAALGDAVPAVLTRCAQRPERATRVLAGLAARIEGLGGVAAAAMFAVAEALLRLGRRREGLPLLVRVGEARVAAGDLLGAREAYALASRTTPDDLDLAETLALLNARLGHREQAIARLRGIAALYRQQARPDRAESAYREILRLDPFSADALLEMAKLRAEQGNRKESAALYHRLGSLRLSAGDLEAAAAHFEEACRLDPTRPEHVRALADALGRALRTGRTTEPLESVLAMLLARRDHVAAVDVAFRILALSPGHARAKTALTEAIRGLSERAATVS
jgi:tetratricopeptide (TPR) repeat protein